MKKNENHSSSKKKNNAVDEDRAINSKINDGNKSTIKKPSVPKDSVNIGPLDSMLTEKAVKALIQYHQNPKKMDKEDENNRKSSLFSNDVPIRVHFTLERSVPNNQFKPIPIQIPHPLHKLFNGADANDDTHMHDDDSDDGVEEPEVCLIVKDESKTMVQELIDEFPNHMKCIKKVLTLSSLRTKYKEFKHRRELLHTYTSFLADDRILPMLTTALGRDFLKSKKQPIPVRVTRKSSLPFAIQKALSSTFLIMTAGGNCISILAGNTAMPVHKLVQNIIAIADHAVPKLPRKWSNIRSIGIKLPESVELPIYSRTPEQLLEIAKEAGLKPHFKEMAETQEEDNVKTPKDKEGKSSKKRKSEQQQNKAKSPLLRAIKKQKKQEQVKEENVKNEDKMKETGTSGGREGRKRSLSKEEEEKGTKNRTAELSSQMKKKKKYDDDIDENMEAETPNKVKLVETKKDSTSSKYKSKNIAIEETTASKKAIEKEKSDATPKKTIEKETPKKVGKKEKSEATPKKTVEKKIPEASSSSSTKKKERNKKKENEPAEKNSSKVSEGKEKEKSTFIASTKYTGSKKGYVYKKDKQGLGYYIDQPPTVDPMVLDAFLRMAKKNSSKGGGGDGGNNRRHSSGDGGRHHNKSKNRRKSR